MHVRPPLNFKHPSPGALLAVAAFALAAAGGTAWGAEAGAVAQEGAAPSDFGRKLATLIIHAHPVFVHFPISFAVGALAAEAGRVVFKAASMTATVRTLLWFAVIGGLMAGGSGWLKCFFGPYSTAPLEPDIKLHRLMGTLAFSSLLISAISFEFAVHKPGVSTWVFRLLLLAAVAVTCVTGHLGGSLVFGSDHLKWSAL